MSLHRISSKTKNVVFCGGVGGRAKTHFISFRWESGVLLQKVKDSDKTVYNQYLSFNIKL